jgi:AcrR family transcriptional regulator
MSKPEPPVAQEPLNHRTQVAGARREKTRARLLKGALCVFAHHGADAAVIDLVIRESGVSRGTFYNYFRNNEALFVEVATEVSNEIIRIVDPLVQQQEDPAARIACGVSTVIRLAIDYPVFARFVSRGGPLAVSTGSLATEVVPRDIAAGIASGRFSVLDQALAFDLILGPVLMAFHRVLSGAVTPNYAQELAEGVLLSLGVRTDLARQFATQQFGTITLADDSLFKPLQSPADPAS